MRFAGGAVFLACLSLTAAAEPFALQQRIGSPDDPHRPESLRAIAVSPDGRLVALAGEAATPTENHPVQLREVATGKLIRTLAEHETVVRAIAFSARGDRLATITSDTDGVGVVRVFDVETGRRSHVIDAGGHFVQFLPDGRLAATGFGQVLLFDPATGQEVGRRPTMPIVKDVSRDGRRAVGVSHHGSNALDVHDLDAAKSIARLTGSTAEPLVASFSPDGGTVAASDPRSRTVLVWEVLTGQIVHTLEAGTTVMALAFTRDGRYLIAGGIDDSFRSWEVATGSDAGSAAAHDGAITVLADGPEHMLLSGGTDRTAAVWSLANLNRSTLPAPPIADADLDAAWESLASPDARTAYRALGLMERNTAQVLPAVRSRVERQLLPVPEADLDRLFAELNNADYLVRERAAATLARAGDVLRPQFEQMLATTDSPEVRARLRLLLDRSGRSSRFTTGDFLRLRRLIGTVKMLAGDESKRLLTLIADEFPDPAVANEALEALERLGSATE
ncbi:MAG: hypothetical protein WBC44_22965 [Planctomycetaceae bacterium]